ncbi:MAG: cytochrome C [Bryobacterales bacterium]|nr:cytochrome C [Bryobacterales bacterium]
MAAEAQDTGRYWRIAIAAALMAATAFVGGRMLLSGPGARRAPMTGEGDTPSLPVETGVFRLAPHALEYRKPAEGEPAPPGSRTLQSFYQRRAYAGAPPVIPHKLLNAQAWGGASCLACHQDGGYTPEFKAMAPVTPHPELAACVQCHVPQQEAAGAFRATTFTRLAAPEIDNQALPGSPPPIPHDLQMRSNCLACHAGPAAVREVRTDHPERVNCRQCHAWNASPEAAFERVGQ